MFVAPSKSRQRVVDSLIEAKLVHTSVDTDLFNVDDETKIDKDNEYKITYNSKLNLRVLKLFHW